MILIVLLLISFGAY
ncbi:type I toxin-antitoxin system Ibs family toxin [Escherichia coli]